MVMMTRIHSAAVMEVSLPMLPSVNGQAPVARTVTSMPIYCRQYVRMLAEDVVLAKSASHWLYFVCSAAPAALHAIVSDMRFANRNHARINVKIDILRRMMMRSIWKLMS